MPRLPLLALLPIFLVLPLRAGDFTPRTFTVSYSGGASPMNRHGHSVFHSYNFEVSGRSRLMDRWIRTVDVGASLTYSDVTQARSWFGYTYGDPDDRIRAEWLFVFARRHWLRSSTIARPYAEIGTGPMFSNRRIPAATSKLNFNSQLGAGITFLPESRFPLVAGWRFMHISNGGIASRNPGVNVNTFILGTQLYRWR
jgi:hypothetical protein